MAITINTDGQPSSTIPDLSGSNTTLYPEYKCRAWVNFNGTGTVAIRGSGNVTSITDNGVGAYTVNFTTAMPDINYATSIMSGDTTNFYLVNEANYFALRTVSATRIDVIATNLSSRSDSAYLSFGVFR